MLNRYLVDTCTFLNENLCMLSLLCNSCCYGALFLVLKFKVASEISLAPTRIFPVMHLKKCDVLKI